MALAAVLIASGVAMTPWQAMSASAGVYGPSGLGGGGSVNALALAPNQDCSGGQSPRALLAGGDVFGMYQSLDAGDSWQPGNSGLTDRNQTAVAGLGFEPDPSGTGNNTEAYAWVGRGV